jgi:hypothetical protein
LLTAIALLTALLPAAACARAGGPAPGGSGDAAVAGSSTAPDSATPTGSTAPSGASALPPSADCPDGLRTGTATITDADNGKRLCVATGTSVEVYLRGTADSKWSPPAPDGKALRPVFNGKAALAVGVTGGFFLADEPGVVHLSSHRAASPSGGMACQALVSFQVTVSVR